MKNINVTMTTDVAEQLKDFHRFSEEDIENLQTEVLLEEGYGVYFLGDSTELKAYYVYETDEGRTSKIELLEEQEIILASNEEELLMKINKREDSNGRAFDNKLIVTLVSPAELINNRKLPWGSVFCYIEPWKLDKLEWEEEFLKDV